MYNKRVCYSLFPCGTSWAPVLLTQLVDLFLPLIGHGNVKKCIAHFLTFPLLVKRQKTAATY